MLNIHWKDWLDDEASILWTLMWRANSFEKALNLGKIEGRRRIVWQRMKWLDESSTQWTLSLSKLLEVVKNRESLHAAVHGVANSWTWLSKWITTFIIHGSQHTRLFMTSWTEAHQIPLSMGFSKKNSQEESHSLLQGIYLSRDQTQVFLHCRWILYHLRHQGSPVFIEILVIFIINEIIIFIYQIDNLQNEENKSDT